VTCDDGHCVTCSDEAVAMTVRELRADGIAVCDEGVEVMTDLVGGVTAGEVVLVHAGVALQLAERPEAVRQ
jgi:hydrogenase expression/formation protein HypC